MTECDWCGQRKAVVEIEGEPVCERCIDQLVNAKRVESVALAVCQAIEAVKLLGYSEDDAKSMLIDYIRDYPHWVRKEKLLSWKRDLRR